MAVIPSARAKPLAEASNVLQEASGDSTPSLKSAAVVFGLSIRLVPPTIAAEASPKCRARHASCKAAREAEHPVFITKLIMG